MAFEMRPAGKDVLRFGAFEFDRESGELRKSGLRIQLQGQPAAILGLLLERAGEVVSRQELRERLWPSGSFVDFERGLNAGITRLRVALGDSADTPRFLETVPRRGYRFLAPVSGSRPVATGLRRLIVLPFDQLQPDPETAFLCFSLPDAITSSLAGLRGLVVRASRLYPVASNWMEAAAQADVDAVMTGSLLRSAGRLRVSAQLSSFPDGTVLWTHSAQVPMGEMFALQDDLAQRILQSILPSVAQAEGGQRRRDVPSSARAYEFFLRGNHLSAQMRDLTLARQMYQRCLDDDPEFAPAWAKIARCHRILAKFRADFEYNTAQADKAFERALALNPDSPGILSQFAYHEADRGRAKDAAVRLVAALRQNPNDPDHLAALVHVCRFAGLAGISIAAHDAAVRLDRNARTSVMHSHFVMGDYGAALATSTDDAGLFEAMMLDMLGRGGEALDRVRRRDGLPPLVRDWLLMLEAYLEGRAGEAVARILEIERQGVDPEGFYYRARLLARLGHHREALDGLGRALSLGYCIAPALGSDPFLHSLRDTGEFHSLAAAAERLASESHAAFREAGGLELLP